MKNRAEVLESDVPGPVINLVEDVVDLHLRGVAAGSPHSGEQWPVRNLPVTGPVKTVEGSPLIRTEIFLTKSFDAFVSQSQSGVARTKKLNSIPSLWARTDWLTNWPVTRLYLHPNYGGQRKLCYDFSLNLPETDPTTPHFLPVRLPFLLIDLSFFSAKTKNSNCALQNLHLYFICKDDYDV